MVKSLLILASLLAAADALTVLRAQQASLDKDEASLDRAAFEMGPGPEELLVHYINLDWSTNRKEHTESLLNQMNIEYERYSAVTRDEARNLDLKEFSDEGTFQEYMEKQYNEDAQWGTVACWTSHMRLLKDISQDTNPKRIHIILEDDFAMNNMAPEDLIPSVMDDIAQLPEDWDLFKFGYFSEGGCEEGKKITDNICQWTHWDMKVMGNLGYALTAKGAKTMLQHIRSHQIADLDGAMMPDCEGADCGAVQPNFYATTSSHLTSIMGSLGGSARNPEHTWDLKEIPADYGSKQRSIKLKKAGNPFH